MIRLALIALLAGCSAAQTDVVECIDEPGAPCCTPTYDLERDGCPQDGQELSTLSDAWRCLTNEAFDGPWVEHDGGRVTAFGHESPYGLLRTQCEGGRVLFVSEQPAGESECVSECFGDCDTMPVCEWAI